MVTTPNQFKPEFDIKILTTTQNKFIMKILLDFTIPFSHAQVTSQQGQQSNESKGYASELIGSTCEAVIKLIAKSPNGISNLMWCRSTYSKVTKWKARKQSKSPNTRGMQGKECNDCDLINSTQADEKVYHVSVIPTQHLF